MGPTRTNRRFQQSRWNIATSAWIEPLETRVLLSGTGLDQNGLFVVPGGEGERVDVAIDFVFREAAFRSDVGIFRVDTSQGDLGGLGPTASGYAQAALTDESHQLLFQRFAGVGSHVTYSAHGGDRLGLYLIQNSDVQSWLSRNPNNLVYQSPLAFFSATSANSDHFDHMRSQDLGSGVFEFQWEDLTYGGDRDFNDFVVRFTILPQDAAPEVALLSDATVTEGTAFNLSVTASDADSSASELRFSLANGSPAGLSLNPSTGLVSWTPTESQGPGTYPVTVRVTDEGGRFDDVTFSIIVTEFNQAPTLTIPTTLNGKVSDNIQFTATATDSDQPLNELIYSLVDPPTGATIDPSTGAFRWTPGIEFAGTVQRIIV